MLIYIMLLLFVIISHFFFKKFKGGVQLYYRLVLLILFCISTFRAEQMGADYSTYINIFKGIQIKGLEYPYEKGYVLLNMLAGLLSDHYVVLALSVNLLFFICFHIYYSKYVDKYQMYIIFFVFVANPYLYIQGTFNILRQSCATAIIMLGITFLIERKYVRYAIVVVLAAQFHSIAYVFLLLIVFRMISWSREKFMIIVSVTCGMSLLLANDSFLNRIAKFFGFGSYIGYGNTEFDFPIYVLFIYVVTMFFLSSYHGLFNDEKEKFFLDLYIFSLCLLPLLVKNDIAYRIYIMFMYLALPALPVIWKSFYNSEKKANYYVCIGGYSIYYMALFILFFYQMDLHRNIHYIPFEFFWQS